MLILCRIDISCTRPSSCLSKGTYMMPWRMALLVSLTRISPPLPSISLPDASRLSPPSTRSISRAPDSGNPTNPTTLPGYIFIDTWSTHSACRSRHSSVQGPSGGFTFFFLLNRSTLSPTIILDSSSSVLSSFRRREPAYPSLNTVMLLQIFKTSSR